MKDIVNWKELILAKDKAAFIGEDGELYTTITIPACNRGQPRVKIPKEVFQE